MKKKKRTKTEKIQHEVVEQLAITLNKEVKMDFKKWIAEAVHEADAKTYGVSVSDIENYERFAVIDRAVQIIDHTHGKGYAVEHPLKVADFLLECISKIEYRLQVIKRQGGLGYE